MPFIEALAGLALIVGLGTRLAGLGVLLLSVGILVGAGWLGPTCLDEWQIGAFGIVGGAALLLGGGGEMSLDRWGVRRGSRVLRSRWLRWAMDPAPQAPVALALGLAIFSLGTTLATNQVFHGGLWGPLHNDSVRPRVDVLDARVLAEGELQITLERPVGPETYGAFVVQIRVLNDGGVEARAYDAEALSGLDSSRIDNRWLVKVRPGPHGLIVPLGGRATITLPTLEPLPPGEYRLELEDVRGATWTSILSMGRVV